MRGSNDEERAHVRKQRSVFPSVVNDRNTDLRNYAALPVTESNSPIAPKGGERQKCSGPILAHYRKCRIHSAIRLLEADLCWVVNCMLDVIVAAVARHDHDRLASHLATTV